MKFKHACLTLAIVVYGCGLVDLNNGPKDDFFVPRGIFSKYIFFIYLFFLVSGYGLLSVWCHAGGRGGAVGVDTASF